MCVLSHVRLFSTLWTVAHQAPLSMEFSIQKYWSGMPFPTPEDLPDPGIEPVSCIGRCNLYHWTTWEAPCFILLLLLLSRFSRVQLFVAPWIVAHQASLPMEFSTQAYCSGLPFPILGGLPDPGIQPTSLSLSGGFFTTSAIWEAHWSTGAHSVVVLWYIVLSFVYLMYPTVIIS